MNPFESILEDEELLLESDLESVDGENFDEAFDEASPAERRQRARYPGRIRVGRTPAGRGYVRPRPASGYATHAQLQAGLARVGADIRANGEAVKRVAAQINKVTSNIGAVNARQDTEISALRKDLKKTDEGGKNQSQLAMLLMLLQKAPELEAKSTADQPEASKILNQVQVKKQDTTLPLVLTMMAGTSGLGGSDNSMQMMLPLFLLLDK